MRRAMKVLSGVVFATAISGLTVACSDNKTSEPVQADDKAPKVPDMPGAGAGEGADKAAGAGNAGAAATPEKSQPNTEAAKAAKPTKGKKGKGGAAASASSLKPGDATVNGDMVNVRDAGANSGKVVRKLKKGEKVTIKECKGGWCQIGDKEFVGQKLLTQ